MKADLHNHTNISDCNFSQEELILMAKKNGVTHLAITDHDTTIGIDEAVMLGSKYAIEVIPGIEISAYDYTNNRKCHIVGLYVPTDNESLQALIENVSRQRSEASIKQIEILINNGYDINLSDFEGVKGACGIYKQHIMDVLVKKGYAKKVFGEEYRQLFHLGGICHMTIDYPDACDAVKVLKGAGAFPILAHPGAYNNLNIVDKLVGCGLMGIEGVYPSCRKADRRVIEELSEKHGLVITGGSDFHGRYGGDQTLGVGDYVVEPTVVDEIKKRLKK